jgi:signal peptidase II
MVLNAERGTVHMVWTAIIVLIIAADQVTKLIAMNNIEYGEMITVLDKFLYFTYHENTGAAWGIFPNGRYVFIVLTIIVSVALIYYLMKNENKFLRISLSFIIAGALGNWIDRVIRGSVIDFIDLRLWSFHFNIFNIADTFIQIGTIMLAVYILFIHEDKKSKGEENGGNNTDI